MKNNNLNVKEIERSSIAHRTYKSIKELILSKEIKHKINQEEIAGLLGISRTPVVIALNQLASEGYLTQIPYKGFFIKKYSKKELEDINEIRIIYELLGIEKLIKNISKKKIKVLEDFIKKLKNYCMKNDIGKYRDLDARFHNYIVKQTTNQYIINQYLECVAVPDETSSFIPLKDSLEHHIEIVDSIILKDIRKSKKIIEKHIGALIFND